jgi:hypothetical protein
MPRPMTSSTPDAPPAVRHRSTDKHPVRRRVALFQRMGLVGSTDPGLVFKRAITHAELAEAYTLVHDVFLERGYIRGHADGMRMRLFEALPDTTTFVAMKGDRVVGVMALVIDSQDAGLPSDPAFGDELAKLRARSRHVGEVTSLALDPEYRNSTILFELARCIYAKALMLGLDDLFIAVSPGHSGFFETILHFVPCGDERDYGCFLAPDPVVGRRLNLRTFSETLRQTDSVLGGDAFLHDWFFDTNPHHRTLAISQFAARRHFFTPDLLRGLFAIPGGLLSRLNSRDIETLRHRWGELLFAQVVNAFGADAA